MRRLLVGGAAAALLAGGAGMALAAGPGPNGHNNYGLCNAYQHGSQQGQSQKQGHGQSFIALAQTAGDYNGDGTTDSNDVIAWCADNAPHPGNSGK